MGSLPGCPTGLTPQARNLPRASELKVPPTASDLRHFPSLPQTRIPSSSHLHPHQSHTSNPDLPLSPRASHHLPRDQPSRRPPGLLQSAAPKGTARTLLTHHPPRTLDGLPATQLSEPGAILTPSCQPLMAHDPVQYHIPPIPTLNSGVSPPSPASLPPLGQGGFLHTHRTSAFLLLQKLPRPPLSPTAPPPGPC